MPHEGDPVGLSEEVIKEHAHRHCEAYGCDPSLPAEESPCNCGSSLVLICVSCRRPVFVALLQTPMCEHAQWLLENNP